MTKVIAGRLRELHLDEYEIVSGAGENGGTEQPEIVVTAARIHAEMHGGGGGGGGGGYNFSGFSSSPSLFSGAFAVRDDGVQWLDLNNNGVGDDGDEIVITASREQIANARDGSFYGGFWAAFGLGGQASGGGGQSHGSAGLGLGVGFELGYSSDSGTAADNGDNTELNLPTDLFDFDFDWEPFTFSIKANGGIYMPAPGLELHNDNYNDRGGGGRYLDRVAE